MKQPLSILLIEDETTYAQLIELFLLDHDHHIQKAYSMTEAQRLLDHSFDVIITDVNLPDGNGVQFVNLVRQQWPNIAVIFITGYLDDADILSNLMSKHKVTLLKKPFSLNSLLEEITLLTVPLF